jgi:hypothetical protein
VHAEVVDIFEEQTKVDVCGENDDYDADGHVKGEIQKGDTL